MSNKSFKAIKDLTKDELGGKLRELESELFQARMKKATGQLADVASLWRLRKQVARAKTVQTQLSAGKAR